MMSGYYTDTDCYRSFSALRDNLYYNKKANVTCDAISVSRNAQNRQKRKIHEPVNYINNESIILAIQNDSRFINVVLNCRKQRSPIAYIFIESDQFVSCVIKNSNGYPIMYIRMNIDNSHVIANSSTNNIYEFPLSGIVSKDVKIGKNINYAILLMRENQEINFVYELYNNDMEPNRNVIRNISIASISNLNRLFKTDNVFIPTSGSMFQSVDVATQRHADDINYLITFFNMSIIIIREVQDINSIVTFNQKASVRTTNYLEISNSKFIYVTEAPKNKSEKYLCSSDDSIVWKVHSKEQQIFDLLTFESLFKINYSKTVTSNDKIYYLFTSFLDKYMLIKCISPMNVRENPNLQTLASAFGNEYQILECYICVKQQSKA